MIKYIKNLFINIELNNKKITNMGNNEIKSHEKSYESSLFLKCHKSKVSHIIILRDGRLSSCSFDKKIIIYKKHSFQIAQIIEGKNSFIFHIQLSNNNIIGLHTNCSKNALEIYELKNKKYKLSQEIIIEEERKLRKIIEMDDKTVVLCFKYIILQIYKIDESKKYKKIMEKWIISSKRYGRLNIIKVNESELAYCLSALHQIFFLDIKNNLKQTASISNIDCSERKNSMLMLNDKILIVFAKYTNGIYLIDIKKHTIIKKIMKGIFCCSMIKLLNGNFLVGYKDRNNKSGLTEYKYEKELFAKIKSVEEKKYLFNFCEMKDGKIASLSGNNKIKIFSNINSK